MAATKKKPAATPAAKRPAKKTAAEPAPRSSRKAKPKKPRVGRPPKKPSERRAERVILRLTTNELASIRVAANAAGVPVSTWIVHVAFLVSRKSP